MIVICIQAFAFQILIATCRSCQTLPPCLQQDRPTMWWCNVMKHFVNTKNFWPSLLFSSQTPLWTPLWKSSDPPQCPTWTMFKVDSCFVLFPPCLLYNVVIWGGYIISFPFVWFHVGSFVFRPFEGLVVLKELAEGAKENSELFELQKVVAMLAVTLGEDINSC